jgi:hypothetical protein
VTLVLNKAALGLFSLPVLRFSPVYIIPPMPHPHLHLHVVLTRKINVASRGTFQEAIILYQISESDFHKYIIIITRISLYQISESDFHKYIIIITSIILYQISESDFHKYIIIITRIYLGERVPLASLRVKKNVL